MMKNEPKINRGTVFHFSTICPTISGVKNLLINEGDFGVKILFICHGNICRSVCAEMVMKHLNVGGYILADNTLWDGHVVEEEAKDAQTEGIRAFNDWVAKDDRVEKVILPLRDGLTIMKKVKGKNGK